MAFSIHPQQIDLKRFSLFLFGENIFKKKEDWLWECHLYLLDSYSHDCPIKDFTRLRFEKIVGIVGTNHWFDCYIITNKRRSNCIDRSLEESSIWKHLYDSGKKEFIKHEL